MKLSPCEDSEIIYSSVVSYLHPRSLERAPYSSNRLYLTHFSPAAWPVGTAPQRTLSASLGSLKSTSEAGEVVKDLFLTLSRQATCPPTKHPGPSGMWAPGPGSSLCDTEVRTLSSSPQRRDSWSMKLPLIIWDLRLGKNHWFKDALLPKPGCSAGCCLRVISAQDGDPGLPKAELSVMTNPVYTLRGFAGCLEGQGWGTCFHLSPPAETAPGKPVTRRFKWVENTGSGASLSGLESWTSHFLALQTQASYFHALWLWFLLGNQENYITYFIEWRGFEFIKNAWCVVSAQWISAIFIIYPVISE